MNRSQTPFWKQPMGIALIGFGGALLLGTGWLAFSRLGPSPSSDVFTPSSNRIDENALIAANAERPGETAAPAETGNAIQASADNKLPAPADEAAPPVIAPPPVTTAPPVSDKPAGERFDPEQIIAEAQAAAEEAAQEVEDALGGKDEDDK